MSFDERRPSVRARIYNLVRAYQVSTGKAPKAVWDRLYDAFEYKTNTNWRKMAYQNSHTVLDAIHACRRLDELLECARDELRPESARRE